MVDLTVWLFYLLVLFRSIKTAILFDLTVLKSHKVNSYE